jgi:hypothetical protein
MIDILGVMLDFQNLFRIALSKNSVYVVLFEQRYSGDRTSFSLLPRECLAWTKVSMVILFSGGIK